MAFLRFAFSSKFYLAAALVGGLAVSGCVLPDTPEKQIQLEETNDPFEPMNRYIFDVNVFLDEIVFKPAAAWYNLALPNPAQTGIHNALANLRMPWTAVNDFFQGDLERTYVALARFVINSTVGVLGVFDVATDLGFPAHEEDAGQTFATTLGLPDGPYLVLPVFGPSNPRDALGLAVDFIADPVNIVARRADRDTILPTVRSGVTAIDARARNIDTIEDLRKNSVDFYATIRSVYRQRRANEIRNGAPGSNFPAPSLSGESAPVSTQAASPQQ